MTATKSEPKKGKGGRRSSRPDVVATRPLFGNVSAGANERFLKTIKVMGGIHAPKRGRPVVLNHIEINHARDMMGFAVKWPTPLFERFQDSSDELESFYHYLPVYSEPEAQDPSDLALTLGGPPGVKLGEFETDAVLRKIVASARDIFASEELAEDYLATASFDSSKRNARVLVAAGMTATVLSKLDELRYGTRG